MSQFLGRYAEAIAHLRQAIVLSQRPEGELTQARNRLFLAAAEREKGWSDSSKAELLQVHQLFRRKYLQPAFLMFLGKALARAGEPTLAEEVRDTLARRAHEGNPEDNANLLVVAGEIALARGHADSAVRSFQAAQVIDSSAFVMESLAHGLAAAGQLSESARRYEALASAPRDWFGWEAEQDGLDAPLSAAALYERLGDASRARAAYERQLAQWSAPDSDLVSLRLAHDGLKRLRGLEMQREGRR
jgi:tetratricopeptide (TPR) repeat protein